MAAKTSIDETLLSNEPAACVAEVLPVSKKRTLGQEVRLGYFMHSGFNSLVLPYQDQGF